MHGKFLIKSAFLWVLLISISKTKHPVRSNTAMTVQFEYYIKHHGFLPLSGSAGKNAIHYVRCVR